MSGAHLAGGWGRAGTALLVAGAYLLLDWASFLYQLSPLGITPWNPQAGLALAAILLGGWPMALAVLAGACAADPLLRPGAGPWSLSLECAAIFTGVYGLTAWLLGRRLKLRLRLPGSRDVLILLAGGAAAAALVAAALVGLYWRAGLVGGDRLVPAVARYWIGDMIGVAVLVPLILMSPSLRGLLPNGRGAGEVVAQVATLGATFWLIFGLKEAEEFRFFYLLFLPMIWVGVRFGAIGAVIANGCVQLGLIAAMVAAGHGSTTVTAFQFLMLTLVVATLVLGVTVDERRRAEGELHDRHEELARLARLSLAGELAAALAHELNQPLMAASAFARAGQRLLATDPVRADAAIGRAVAETQRAGDIIRALREFIGLGQGLRQAVDMADLVADTLALASPEARRRGVRLSVAVDKALPPVHADRAQIQQILLNLLRNGIEATQAGPPSRRTVAIAVWRVAVGMGGEILEGDKAGEGICVEVADQGPGLAPDVAERLFSPFNTSKAEGMGLGLSISRSMVQAHGGRLWLDRSDSRGAAFRFFLPVAPREGHEKFPPCGTEICDTRSRNF